MNARVLILSLVAAAVIAGGGYGLYQLGIERGAKTAHAAGTNGSSKPAADASGRKVLYWHDPMVPGQKFDKPGKSPFMDMDLVPVYADEGADEGGVTISPRVQQNLGIRLAEVTKGEVAPTVEAVGIVAYNERDVAMVQARANGFLEKLHVRAPLDPVRAGQPLAELYVPDWVAAQEEYLGVVRMGNVGIDSLRDGAVQRMRLMGMPEDLVKRVVAEGRVIPRITVTAPIGGVIGELSAREGMTVMSGAPLFRINGLSTIWVNAEVPESVVALVRPGNVVEAQAAAIPGKTFKGKVSAILPEVSAQTRTIKARVELANPGSALVPGMFATVNFSQAAKRAVLMVPSEAVIQTGKRNVVIVSEAGEKGQPRYRPVDVELGAESGGRSEIVKGLEPGMKVVVSGQFLIDSEASLKSTMTRLGADAPSTAAGGEKVHTADGRIESVDAESVLLSHGPIPSLNWGAMTMEFKLRKGVSTQGIKDGSAVNFDFVQTPKGEFEITRMAPTAKTTASRAPSKSPSPPLPQASKAQIQGGANDHGAHK